MSLYEGTMGGFCGKIERFSPWFSEVMMVVRKFGVWGICIG